MEEVRKIQVDDRQTHTRKKNTLKWRRSENSAISYAQQDTTAIAAAAATAHTHAHTAALSDTSGWHDRKMQR